MANRFFDDFSFDKQNDAIKETPKPSDEGMGKSDFIFGNTKTQNQDKRSVLGLGNGPRNKKPCNRTDFGSRAAGKEENFDMGSDIMMMNFFGANNQASKQSQKISGNIFGESGDVSFKQPEPGSTFNLMDEPFNSRKEFVSSNKQQQSDNTTGLFIQNQNKANVNVPSGSNSGHFIQNVNVGDIQSVSNEEDQFFSTNQRDINMIPRDNSSFGQYGTDFNTKQPRVGGIKQSQQRLSSDNIPPGENRLFQQVNQISNQVREVSATLDPSSNFQPAPVSDEVSLREVALMIGREQQMFYEKLAEQLGKCEGYELNLLKEIDELIADATLVEENLRKQKETLKQRLLAMTQALMQSSI